MENVTEITCRHSAAMNPVSSFSSRLAAATQ
jgi:hypothetical protein